YKSAALPLMKFLIKHMGGDSQAAEEVFSQTILAALKGWHKFRHKSQFFTWVCRIALNKTADYYRNQIHQESKFIAPILEKIINVEDKDLLPEEKLILKELRISVKECLMLLPEDKRRMLYLKFWQELSLREIARICGVSERAAEGKLYRAKLALREVISERYPALGNK
ncbi:MAG: sigma-70 family RNA polymerase sigma factor, partial [Candidatus Daviesbacteria bacterium]